MPSRRYTASLLACLATAAAGGTLEQLTVQWASFSPLQLGASLVGATRLRSLAVCTSQQDGLRLTRGSLAGLPALQNLTLAGAISRGWGRRVALPPSLTRLVLPLVVDSKDNCLPLQVGAAGRGRGSAAGCRRAVVACKVAAGRQLRALGSAQHPGCCRVGDRAACAPPLCAGPRYSAQLAGLTALRSLEMYIVEPDDEEGPDDDEWQNEEEYEEDGEGEEDGDSDGSASDGDSESAGEESESEGGSDSEAEAQGAAGSDGSPSEDSSEEEGSDGEGAGGIAGPMAAPDGQLPLAPGSADPPAAGGFFAPLASLGGSLRHLAIHGGSRWPRGLAALTGLQALDLRAAQQWAGDDLRGLQEALNGMTGLTSFILEGMGPVGGSTRGAPVGAACAGPCSHPGLLY